MIHFVLLIFQTQIFFKKNCENDNGDLEFDVRFSYFSGYIDGLVSFLITLAGLCGVIHYICINTLSILSDPRGIKPGLECLKCLKLVFIPFILLSLCIVGLVPCCCCQKVDGKKGEDYDEIIKIRSVNSS